MSRPYRTPSGIIEVQTEPGDSPGEERFIHGLPAAVVGYLSKLVSSDTALASILSALTSTLTVGLPSGASTAANQTTGNSSLSSIASALSGTLTAQLVAGTAGAATAVAMTTSSTTLIVANPSRIGLYINNPLGAPLYVRFENADAAAVQTFTLPAGASYEMPRKLYTGIVKAALATGSGNVFVTEVT